jgi:hypothetical protein
MGLVQNVTNCAKMPPVQCRQANGQARRQSPGRPLERGRTRAARSAGSDSLTQQANASRSGGIPAGAPDNAATARLITFKRPPTGLSDLDAADSLPAGLNLALCSYKSGADEAY